jgi:predicted esterase
LAQTERFELGLRLKAFESAFEDHAAPEARKRVLNPLQQSVTSFFRLRLGEAARSLDQAKLSLFHGDKVPLEARWAASLSVRPSKTLLDAAVRDLELMVSAFYDPQVEKPAKVSLRLVFTGPAGQRVRSEEFRIESLPASINFRLPENVPGDGTLATEIVTGDRSWPLGALTISRVPQLEKQRERLAAAIEGMKSESTAAATLASIRRLLDGLHEGRVFETNIPASRLLHDAELILSLKSQKKTWPMSHRPGEYWMTLAVENREVPIRLFVPEAATKATPLPLVIALHGAGGSEHLFYEGYGRGKVVSQCRERGWILVSPRSIGFGGAPLPAMIEEISKSWPVDRRRVFVVGHSMGAGQAIAAIQRDPKVYAAAAALGGGAGLRQTAALKDVGLFVGCGDKDFAISGARALAKSAMAVDGAKVVVKEFADIEHLAIVQIALPEVFAFFDSVAKQR